VKVAIDSAMCVGHAQCSAICPAVFGNDELGYAILVGDPDGTVDPADAADARDAVASCPEQALAIVEP
jgi:ferredoxin